MEVCSCSILSKKSMKALFPSDAGLAAVVDDEEPEAPLFFGVADEASDVNAFFSAFAAAALNSI